MTSTTLKSIALVFMLLDHIGEFILPDFDLLRWIGRLSAPIFSYCVALGFYYTRNKKIYMIRMYLFGVFMAVGNNIIQNTINIEYRNNIFITLFISTVALYIIETLQTYRKKGIVLLLLFIGWQIFSTIIIRNFIFDSVYLGLHHSTFFFSDIFANSLACEGGIIQVFLPIVLYFAKDNKKNLVITYFTYSLVYSILYATNIIARVINIVENNILKTYLSYFFDILNVKIQVSAGRFYEITSYFWMIIFSLPFILAYNGKKGEGNKMFFYIFYPTHIYVLCFLNIML